MQCAEQPITRCILIQENNVSRLFSPQIRTDLKHSLHHIAVSDCRLFDMNAVLLSHVEKAQIAHHCRNNRIIF